MVSQRPGLRLRRSSRRPESEAALWLPGCERGVQLCGTIFLSVPLFPSDPEGEHTASLSGEPRAISLSLQIPVGPQKHELYESNRTGTARHRAEALARAESHERDESEHTGLGVCREHVPELTRAQATWKKRNGVTLSRAVHGMGQRQDWGNIWIQDLSCSLGVIQSMKTGPDTLLWGCRIEKNNIITANRGGALPGQVLELLGSLFPAASPPAREVSAGRRPAATSKPPVPQPSGCPGHAKHPAPPHVPETRPPAPKQK